MNWANWIKNTQPETEKASVKIFGPFYYWRTVDEKGGVARLFQIQLPSLRFSAQISFKRHGR